MKAKFDLSTDEGREDAKKYLSEKAVRELRDTFDPRDEMTEQLIVAREARVSYEYLDKMDYLVYDIDFRVAFMMMGASYGLAEKKADEKAKRDARGNMNSQPTHSGNPAERAAELRRMIDSQE